MNKVTCIYHRSDFDGLFCYRIARQFFDSHGYDVEYVGWDYGDPIPEIPSSTKVYMLDISVDGLMEHPNLNWVDHHKSAIDKFSRSIQGYRIDGVAACRLAWQYFGGINSWTKNDKPNKEDFVERRVTEPLAVRLAGEYDIWDRRDPRAELFQFGLRSRELTDNTWSRLLDVDDQSLEVDALIMSGTGIHYYATEQNASIIKAFGFTIDFEGLKFLACNHARFNSHLFDAGLTSEHDACFGFNWDGSKWRVSLYHAPGKESHDLSLIAVKYGGGGHRGACGFRTDNLPFLKNKSQ
jgi:oligoribonuclease NrnB/cAMP/cGMP phosphodiesterase (DHH superfamily)